MHTSRTDLELAGRGLARCGCHQPERRQPERADLRKHHSAEGDKWSLRPDAERELRKHLSDDSRMNVERESKWTLQVPDLHANPRQRCTCPRQPRAALALTPLASPAASPSASDGSRRPSPMLVRSLTPELPPTRRRGESLRRRPPKDQQRASLSPQAQQLDVVHESTRASSPPQQQHQQQQNKKTSRKERGQLGEAKRAIRSKWAVKPHFSLPAERKETKWTEAKEGKSKSLKERPKYSVRRSMSPEPDQILRTDNRVVRRLVSMDVQLRDAKWAPYEGYSPLPAVGIRRRETKRLSDIRWEESPVAQPRPKLAELRATDEPEEAADGPEDFHKITPPRAPPPEASPDHLDEDEQFRMRMLNQVSCFPIYQGAWREESPTPPPTPGDASTPVWSPHDPSTLTAAQLRKQSVAATLSGRSPSPRRSASPPPQPLRKRSTLKARSSRKKAARAKSQDSTRQRDPPEQRRKQSQTETTAPVADARRRPQLQRSQAFALEVPHAEFSKRSLSEEVRSYNPRSESTRRGLFSRAKSEDASRSRRPWSPDEDEDESELREYVTTV